MNQSERIAELREWLLADNIKAFLRVIREGESRQDDLAYQIRYAGIGKKPEVFDDLSDHPRIYEPTLGGLKSSAAGAYQATYSTWEDFLKDLGPFDFSKESQDLFAVWCLNRAKAIPAILEGRFEEACRLCASTWTSLPGGKEENAATKRARETFLKWGGKLAPIKAPNPIAQSFTEKSTVAPFLAAAIPAFFQAAPDLIRLFGKGPMSERNAVVAEKVAEVAKEVTGALNEQDAAQRISADPNLAAEFRAKVAENFDQWMGMLVKFAEIDENSKAKAREFALAYDKQPVLGKFSFIEFLSLIMLTVSAAGAGYVLYDDKFPAEIKGAVVTLVLIGGWTGVKEFWLGSSMGSMRKDNRTQ